MTLRLLLLLCTFLLAMPASAGPIFHLIGGGGIAPEHPNGDGASDRMTLSNAWGIAGTGGGFINTRVTFRDGFVLPSAAGDTVTFSAADIDEVFFDHSQAILTASIAPVIQFTARGSDLTSASGTIVNEGTEIAMTNAGALGPPSFITSLIASRFAAGLGVVTGHWEINGSELSLNGSNAAGAPLVARLRVSSQAKGRFELTGFSTTTATVSEPTMLALLLPGLILVAARRFT